MTEYTVFIQNWRPHTINELLNMHPMARGRAKASDAQMIGIMCYGMKVPKATGKRSVAVTVVCAKGRSLDQDAVQKSLLDGLVVTGYLKDDSPTWLDFKGVTIERGKRISTTITMTDL